MNLLGRKLSLFAAVAAVMMLGSMTFASSFTDIYDFHDTIDENAVTFSWLSSGNEYIHDLSSLLAGSGSGIQFTDATLSLTYMMDTVSTASVWYVDADGSGWWQLGRLNSQHVLGAWLTDSFTVPDGPLTSMSSGGSLRVRFRESPDGVSDYLKMDKSVLNGNYGNPQAPVTHLPEAGTLSLAAMGLLPLGFLARKRR
ncbi:MAG: hypothetical protein ACYC64_09050 [Armatimonadota bacterium]